MTQPGHVRGNNAIFVHPEDDKIIKGYRFLLCPFSNQA
jgi:hypothetical protein